MNDLLLVALISLAAFRATRWIIHDEFTQPVGDRLRLHFEAKWEAKHGVNHGEEWASKVAYLLSCYWCLGFWISGLTTLITWLIVPVPYPVLTALAASAVTGLLGRNAE